MDGSSVEEVVQELVMRQEVLQEMMAALGGHWDNALFSGEGAMLSFVWSLFSFLLLLLFGNMNIYLIWIQDQAISPTCGAGGSDPQVSWLNALHSRGGRPLQAYERSYYVFSSRE